jgi:hypothetical protein
MRKPFLGLFAFVLLASAAPALAQGEVYVPYTSNRSIEGTIYRTKVWVTNTGGTARKFSTRFIEQGTDGTKVPPQPGNDLNVPPGGTLLLTNLAPQDKIGILEISGAPQLVVNARLDALNNQGAVVSSTNMPVISTANVVKANGTAQLQGLERTSRGTLTDFGLVNVSNQQAQCSVKAFRANSTQIAQTVALSVPPLAVFHFSEALLALSEPAVADARIETTCNKQFFPYAVVFKVGGPEASFVTASGTLEGDLVGGNGGNNPPGTVVYELPGIYLNAKNGDSYKAIDLPVVEGVRYKKATVEFDLLTGKFPNGLFAGVHAFRRTDKTMYYGIIVRGDRQKTILDLGVDDDIVTGNNGGPWRERTQYHVSFTYDTESGQLTYRLLRNGSAVETLTGRINHFDLTKNGRAMRVDFGQTGIADGAYFPPIGWVYSNLKVTLEPPTN